MKADRKGYDSPRVGETFPPSVRHTLAELGLQVAFEAAGHLRAPALRSVWGGPEPYDQDYLFNPYGHGWNVDRRAFDASLAAAAEDRGVQVRQGCQLQNCRRDPATSHWALRLDGDPGAIVRCRYAVDATWRRSTLSRSLGATRHSSDRLVGLVARVPASAGVAHEVVTLIEAVEVGWWYSAPIPDGWVVLSLLTDADLWARLRSTGLWPVDAPHTARRLGLLAPVVPRPVAANSSRCVPSWGPGWLAVGDAAAAHDPLCGDGMHRSLRSGVRAAHAISARQAPATA